MKNIWKFLLIAFALQVAIAELAAQNVTIGAGDQLAGKPFDFNYQNSLYETLYYPDEVEIFGTFVGISYYYNSPTVNITGQHVKIWMGTTAFNDLSAGWIPSTQLTLVFDGDIDLLAGQDSLYISFSTPYPYTGQNLVIMTQRPWEGEWIGSFPMFQCQTVGTNRARNFYSDAITPDPANPPTTGATLSITGQFPKTTLHLVDVEVHDLAALSITGNITPTEDTASTYIVAIHNNGLWIESQYSVKLYGPDNLELATSAGVTIIFGQTTEVLVSWTPTTPGITSIYAKVILAGDDNSTNDQTAPMNIVVQPSGTIWPPPPPTILSRVPVDMYYHNSLFETIFPEDDLYLYSVGRPCLINAITFYNNFSTSYLLNMPTKIWLGNTELTDLTAGWVPSTQLTQVFDGNVAYPGGQNNIYINLQTPFFYSGGNLIMMVNRPMDTNYYSILDNFNCFTSTVNCARRLYSDTIEYNPANPPQGDAGLSNIYPVTYFYASQSGLSSLSGVVRNNQNQPISRVTVQITNLNMSTLTDSSGVYSFPSVTEGTYQVAVSKTGYLTQTLTTIITDSQNSTLDFVMQDAPFVSITGRIVNSLVPDLGIDSAQIELEGTLNTTLTTDARGYFSISNVPTNQTYSILVSKAGYQNYSSTVQVSNLDLNLGNMLFNELNLHPFNVQAVDTAEHAGFNIAWNQPYTGDGEEVHYDDGTSYWICGAYPGTPMDAAIRFSTEDLTAYAGMSLFSIKFIPIRSNVTHSIRVWTGGEQGASGDLIVDQLVSNFTVNEWNTIDLDTPVLISGDVELWFGVHYSLSDPTPASHDNSPVHNWKGNLMFTGNSWNVLFIDDPYYDGNWNIRGLLNVDCVNRNNVPIPLVCNPIDQDIEIKGIGNHFEFRRTRSDNSIMDRNRSIVGYQVWRFEPYQQGNPALWTLLTPDPITATAFFDTNPAPALGSWIRRWAVKALYSGNQYSNPAFSNIISGGTPAGLIKGVVTNSLNNESVSEVMITFPQTSNQTITDSNGLYNLVLPPGTYSLTATNDNYTIYQQNEIEITDGDTTTVDIELIPSVANPDEPELIKATILNSCYPNPFNTSTTVSYDIKSPVQTSLEIYNIKGQHIKTLVSEVKKTGRYLAVWNGTDNANKHVAEGMYLLRMKAGEYTSSGKLLHIR